MRTAALAGLVTLSVWPGFCQPAFEAPVFEIADIHPSAAAMNPFTFVSGGMLRGDRYDLHKATMLDLIRIAYQVAPETVLGGPDWLEFDRFDVTARAPARSSPETVRRMLQSLLADRFHLAINRDTRPMPAWFLSKGKMSPKLTQSDGAGESGCKYVQQSPASAIDAYSCRNMSMAAFALRLRSMGGDYLKEPVIDGTGIEGAWDFDIQWTRRAALLPTGAERIAVSAAIEKQLGLQLELRDAPAPVLVIDRVDKPAPNAPDVVQKLPPRPLEFEVADLKLNRNGQRGYPEYTRGGLHGYGMPLLPMLGFAWDINSVHTRDWFKGLPKGVESVYIDVNAKSAERTNGAAIEPDSGFDDDLRAMLQALFVERFRIKWHYENRLTDAYSLISVKPKLKKADPANRASCHEARTIANDPRDINPLLAELISCRNATIAQFASRLQQIDDNQFAYPVQDATGIKGAWDFDLSFTPSRLLDQSFGQYASTAINATPDPNGAVTLAEAIARQLGLRLERRKRMLPAVVIDHMELTPLEN